MGLVSGLYRVRFGVVKGLLRASSTFVSPCCGSGRQPRILPIRQDRREVYVRARVRVCLYVQARGVWVLGRPGRFWGSVARSYLRCGAGMAFFLEIRSYKFLIQERKGAGSIDLSTRGCSIIFLHASVTKNGKNENGWRVCLVL